MNAEPFLRAVEGSNPSGVELRHTPGFLQIEAQQEAAQRQKRIDSNGELNLASAVDWSTVVSDAERLAATGRDIRLLVMVARAWTNQNGCSGLAAGLQMISDSLLEYWDNIHPELRDRDDKAMAAKGREGALVDVESRKDGILGDLEMNVALSPLGLDPVRGSELAQASLNEYEYLHSGPGGLSAAETAERTAAHAKLQARVKTAIFAIREQNGSAFEALSEGIDAAETARAGLEAAYEKAGGFEKPSGFRLKDLQKFLAQCRKALDAGDNEGGDTPGSTGGETMTQTPGPSGGGAPVVAIGGPMPGQLASRKDVEKCLDMIIEFYERTEPSSPIPHLAGRLRRMVPMDFMQLIEEVAPGGLKDFKNVAGVDDKKRSD